MTMRKKFWQTLFLLFEKDSFGPLTRRFDLLFAETFDRWNRRCVTSEKNRFGSMIGLKIGQTLLQGAALLKFVRRNFVQIRW